MVGNTGKEAAASEWKLKSTMSVEYAVGKNKSVQNSVEYMGQAKGQVW